MALPTISAGDLTGKGVTGMPANPELSVADLQEKFDELSIDVIVPKIQALVAALENASAGTDLGVTAPTGITASNKVKSVLDAIAVILLALEDTAQSDYNPLVTLFSGITSVSNMVDGLTTTIPTAKAITEYIEEIGGGDMLRTTYDTDMNGVVDDSEKLGGELPAFYATQQDLTDACAVVSGLQADVTELQSDVVNLTPVDIWVNANPTSSFAGQQITLSETITNFAKYEIEYASTTTAPQAVLNTGKIPIANRTILALTTETATYRALPSAPSGTTMTFGSGQSVVLSTGVNSTLNTVLIPLRVIGYKQTD